MEAQPGTKAVIEIHQTQKLMQLTRCAGLGKLLDRPNRGGQGPYAVPVHVVSKELQGGNAQNALGSVELDAIVLQAGENLAEVG